MLPVEFGFYPHKRKQYLSEWFDVRKCKTKTNCWYLASILRKMTLRISSIFWIFYLGLFLKDLVCGCWPTFNSHDMICARPCGKDVQNKDIKPAKVVAAKETWMGWLDSWGSVFRVTTCNSILIYFPPPQIWYVWQFNRWERTKIQLLEGWLLEDLPSCESSFFYQRTFT